MLRPEFEVYNQDGEKVVSSNYRSQIKNTHSKEYQYDLGVNDKLQ